MSIFEGHDLFGDDVARHYDDSPRGDEDDAARFLYEMAGDGTALEFATGTGRIALPLAALGAQVDGIELSPAMTARLREKPGGDALNIVQGDMATTELPDRYRVVFLVYNTLFNLITQDDQIRCFANAAHHLDDRGVFVVEAAVAGEWYHHSAQYVDAETIRPDHVSLDVGQYDSVTQLLTECHVIFSDAGVRLEPIVTRYSSPAELDLMARLAGLRLRRRWGGWRGESFTRHSPRHVSVYARDL